MQDPQVTPPAEKETVYLVRHAQSLQNVAVAQFYFNGDWAALGRVIRLGYDALSSFHRPDAMYLIQPTDRIAR